MKFNQSAIELDNVCLWYEPLRRELVCCHEMHWSELDQLNLARAPIGTAWPKNMCEPCVLGECDTAMKDQSH